MAAEVDICNTGLSHIGDEATVSAITPPDGSVQAGHCARWYPMARNELLERHTWRINTRRIVLAPASIDPPDGWAFAYAAPNLMLKMIAVISPTAFPEFISWWQGATMPNMAVTSNLVDILNTQPYVIEMNPIDGTPIIYTNVEEANAIYQVIVTDTTKFSPLFTAALARLLASKLAGPIIKGSAGSKVAKEQLAIFEQHDLPIALIADANAQQASPYTSATPAPIAVRY